jgi:integrase
MDFVNELINKLKTEKNISDSSIGVYVRNLKKLNGDKPFGDFSFLDDPQKIVEKISKYKETTKRNYLISIVSILSLFTDKPKIKELHDKYYGMMMTKKQELDAVDPNELTQTQEDNWIDWESVKKKWKELEENVNTFYKKKTIDEAQYNILLAYALLSLYVLVPPRRNKDYQLMNVVNSFDGSTMDNEHNYLDLAKKRFIFNNYKTSKKYGRFDLPIPKNLMTALNKYLKHRETKFPADDNNNKPLLVKADGSFLNKNTNDITRLMNRIFGKHIGSSMLRHIFLTDKYGDLFKTSQEDADAMGHSTDEQKKYIKNKLNVKF